MDDHQVTEQRQTGATPRPPASSPAPAAAPKGAPCAHTPPWTGQTGSLGYLAKMIPRISETFILKEVLALRHAGVPLRIYSLLPPTRDARMHPEAAALLSEIVVLPAPCFWKPRTLLHNIAGCLRMQPGATLRILLRALVRPRRRTMRRLWRATALAMQLRQDRVAHLHAAWAHTPASVARLACGMAGIPWSMGAHAKDIHLSRPASLAKKIIAARYTLTCTRTNQVYLQQIAANRSEVAPIPPAVLMHYHGVDTTYFTPVQEPADTAPGTVPLILSVARLVPKKGLDLTLRAAALLRARGVAFRFEMIGEGPLRAFLKDRIRTLNLASVVTLRGMLVREEVRAAYHQAACMVLASRVAADGDRDGIPNTLAEAMACGVPVVATRLPSIAELIQDGECGILVDPDSAVALADALASLLRSPERRAWLGRKGRERVLAAFDARDWEGRTVERLTRSLGIERVLYLTADRGVPVRGSKGASVHVRSVVRAMKDLGVSLRILTTRAGSTSDPAVDTPLVERSSGRKVKRVVRWITRVLRGGQPLEKSMLRLLDNLRIYREGHRQIRAWHPDMIYERYALTAVAGSLLARRFGIPHLLEVNAPLVEEEARYRGLRLRALTHWMERWLLRRADRVIVVSRALADHARRLGVAADRIVILPNAIDPALFHPRRNGVDVRERFGLNGQFVVGFSGTLKPWHGLHHLLNALATASPAAGPAHLLVVGDGPGRAELQALAGQQGLGGRVHFAGAVRHEDVGTFLAACDVLVAPYGPMDDHWFSPLKVAEYVAVGRPVIASAIGQIAESFDADRGVLLVKPGDERQLAAAIAMLADNRGQRRALAHAACGAPAWHWSDVAKRILQEGERARRRNWGWPDA